MKLYAGLDLHSNNNVLVIINERDQAMFRRRQANVAQCVSWRAWNRSATELAGIVVESTYNWYWLVDELMKSGYRVHLANTAAIRAIRRDQADQRLDRRPVAGAPVAAGDICRKAAIYPAERQAGPGSAAEAGHS